ncbi:MAG: rhodanese-like domain-containing protein [Pseudomonadota bacterium]
MKAALLALMFLLSPEVGTLKNGVVHVDAKEAAELLEARDDVIVLDVRTLGEFEKARIEGATQIDFRSSEFKSKAAKLDPNATYLVHCRSGGRSGRSLSVLKELGLENLYHLDGGLLGWEAASLPVTSGAEPQE